MLYCVYGSISHFFLSSCQNIDITTGKLTTLALKYSAVCVLLLEDVPRYAENYWFLLDLDISMPFFTVSY
jgi:hypothetical protein